MSETLSPTSPTHSVADAHLALAMEAVEMGAWQWDIRQNRVQWSASLERMHGLEPGTFDGTFEAYQRDIHPDDRDHVLGTISQSVQEKQPHYLTYRIVRPDGTVRWLEARGRLFVDEHGQPLRLVGVCMDVTDKRAHEERWRQVQRRQEEAEAALHDQTRLAQLSRDISLALTETAELRRVLQRCVEAVVAHLGAAFARIWTHDDAEQILELQASAGMYTHLDGPHSRVPVGKFKIGLIAHERRPHLTNDVQNDPRVGDHEWARREGMVAFAGYPLLVGDSLLGVLAMFARRPLTESDFNGLGTVANALAVGIARARADEAMRLRAEELARIATELEYQRDLTTAITNNTASALFMMDARGYPMFINTAACEMTGYSSVDEIKHRPLHDAVHFRKPDGSPYPMDECPIDRANAEIVPLRAQRETFCRKNGDLFPIEYNVAPITRDGHRLGAVLEVRDITHELESQRALRESDERFHLLARATNDVIWDWDFVRNTVWWNENFTKTFGDRLDELDPRPESWTSRIHPEDLDRVSYGIHEAIDGQALTWSAEYRFRRADGTYANILDRGIIIRDNAGRARRMIGSMMDVTERERVQAELRRQTESLTNLALALQRSNSDLDQFAYVASHDLKAPLRGIANLSQWIEEDLGDNIPDTTREHLKLMRSRVSRMEGLIEGVLEYSRAGRTPGTPEAVSVRRVVRDVIDLVSPPPTIQFEIADDLPTLHTHRLLLQQVFMNLITNATKYGCGGADPRIRVTARDAGGSPEFAVADNGPGIDPQFQDKIWGIFQTLQPRDTIEGTGIGLALVKKIVEGRGGRVWVESRPGSGATFRFTWPVSPATEAQ